MQSSPNERFKRLRVGQLILWTAIGASLAIVLARIMPRADRLVAFVEVGYVTYAVLLLTAVHACKSAGIPLSNVIGQPPTDAAPWIRTVLIVPPMMMTDALLVLLTIVIGAKLAPHFTARMLSRRTAPDLLPQ